MIGKTLIISVLIYVAITFSATAQQLVDYQFFDGGVEVDTNTELSAQLSQTDSIELDSIVVLNWYRDQGYLQVSIDSIIQKNAVNQLFFTSGCQYSINQILVEGDRNEEANLGIKRYTGIPFTPDNVDEIAVNLLSGFEESGYFLSEARIERIERDNKNCHAVLTFHINKKEKLRVKGVQFSGVQRNNSEYLERVTGLKRGEVITKERIRTAKSHLMNTELFSNVSNGEVIFVNDEPTLLFDVDEQQLNFFDGLIGYVPDQTGSGQIAGFGELLLRNAIRDGNTLDFRFEQLEPFVTKLQLRVEQQFIFGLPLRFGGQLHFTQQDSTYLTREFTLNSGYQIFSNLELMATLRFDRSTITDNNTESPVAFDSRGNYLGLGFNYRALDRLVVPSKGVNLKMNLENGRRFINDDRVEAINNQSFSQTILNSDLRVFYPVTQRFILAPSIHGFILDSPVFLITDLKRFGGAESIRGFREDQFRASQLIWGDIETRYLLEKNSYLFLFGAYGRFKRPALITEQNEVLKATRDAQSLGFGLAFQAPVGLIKFSYAISPDEDLGNGKIHVGIKTGI